MCLRKGVNFTSAVTYQLSSTMIGPSTSSVSCISETHTGKQIQGTYMYNVMLCDCEDAICKPLSDEQTSTLPLPLTQKEKIKGKIECFDSTWVYIII